MALSKHGETIFIASSSEYILKELYDAAANEKGVDLDRAIGPCTKVPIVL